MTPFARQLLRSFTIALALAIAMALFVFFIWLWRNHPTIVVAVVPCLAALGLAGSLFWMRKNAPQSPVAGQDIGATSGVLLLGLAGGFYVLYAAVAYVDTTNRVAAILAVEMWCWAACAFGFAVGFLFGIPRVLQRDTPAANGAAGGYDQRVNTNLEQISDWLTKIIVGLGLVQLQQIPGFLKRVSYWAAGSLPLQSNAQLPQVASFATAFLVYFVIVGFLAGYLLTRLYLAGAFRRADQAPRVVTATFASPAGGDPADALRAFWMPPGAGAPDLANEIKLLNWLRMNGLADVALATFLNASDYLEQRKKAATDLLSA